MNGLGSKWYNRILSAPETNLFLFAFLLNFVYEVWQSPYFDFYERPTLAEKILRLTWRSVLIYTGLGWGYTFLSEIYRTRIAHLYGVFGFTLPGIGISWLPLLQWAILPPLVLYLSRRQVLGYRKAE